jgi:Ion transport protein
VELGQFEEANYPTLAKIVFVLYTAFGTIVLLNLLIALMSNIFEAVQQNSTNEWLLERAKIILEIEAELPKSEKNAENFPLFLHVLRPVSSLVDDSSTDGQASQQEKHRHHVDHQLQNLVNHLTAITRKIDRLESTINE